MIIDLVLNIRHYQRLHKCFPAIFEYLEKTDVKNLSVGKHDVMIDHAYISIDKVSARAKESAYLEAHKKYIDIQIVFSGLDTMGWKPTYHCEEVQKEYDEQKDIVFYKDIPDFFVPVNPGYFVIFFPEDAHMPLIGTGEIHKAIVKIRI